MVVPPDYLNLASTRLRLHRSGQWRESAPTVVAVHGFTGTGRDFEALWEALAPAGVNVLAPDLPGHGQSDVPVPIDAYTLPAQLAVIEAALEQAPRAEPILLLGYSMGGRLALHYLRHHSLPALLISASPGLKTPAERAQRRKEDEQWIQLLESGSAAEFKQRWLSQPILQPASDPPLEAWRKAREATPPHSLHGWAQTLRAVGNGRLPSLWPTLPSLPPLTLVTGEDDLKFKATAEAMCTGNRGFRHQSIAASAHAVHLEAPGALAAVVMECFSRWG
jgi:2-succinyl-6-hydroxy-2,4-cyclohexadiene-1-carboxylate synthase